MNLYNYITPHKNETFTTLLEHKNIKINHIVSSSNIEPVEYIQDEDEWLVLLEGEATVLVHDEKEKLTKGKMLFVPSKVSHSVLETNSGAVWLTVHIF